MIAAVMWVKYVNRRMLATPKARNSWCIEIKRDLPQEMFQHIGDPVKKGVSAFGVSVEDSMVKFTQKKRLFRDFSKFCGATQSDIKTKLPKYYEECFPCFAEYSVANNLTEQALYHETHNTVIWNNKFICIQGKSVFCEALFKKGIIKLKDLATEVNGVITGFQILANASLTPKEKFQLMTIIDAIPTQWRHHLKTCNNYQNNSTCSHSAQLHLNGHNICLDKAISKNIYKEVHRTVKIFEKI